MTRARTIALGTLVLLLAATPFIPRGDEPDRALVPSGEEEHAAPARARMGALTEQMRREIDRVVADGRAVGRVSARTASGALADDLVRCAEFEGQRYCLGTGWTTRTQSEVQARVAAAAARTARSVASDPGTGDLDALAMLRRTSSLSPTDRAASERAELTAAARSVAKVWLLRHEIQGTPFPEGFLADHPEATVSANPTAAPTKPRSAYPRKDWVLSSRRVTEQRRSYWCGPTAMQMIAWGWRDRRQPQRHWARRLGTTSNGTAITDIVRLINRATGWDNENRAGRYITLDISDWSYGKWLLLNMRHVTDYRAPLVLHPILLKRFYPYLDDDASGHFQVGRGYNKRGERPAFIGYFEPWNQQRFDPSEPYIDRVQWRSAYKSYRANRAHPHQNIGV